MDIQETQMQDSEEELSQNEIQLQVYKKIFKGVPLEEIENEIARYKQVQSFQCAAPIEKHQIYFKCSDCSTQPTHCICENCFLNGNHSGHSFLYFNKLTQNSNKFFTFLLNLKQFINLIEKYKNENLKIQVKLIRNYYLILTQFDEKQINIYYIQFLHLIIQGGTCDCGDPNLLQPLLCNLHQKTSIEDRMKIEHSIKDSHKELIIKYFQEQFTQVYQSFEEQVSLQKDTLNVESYKIDYFSETFQEQIIQFKNLIKDIQTFITDNPSGTFTLSKILMEACPNFICHHVCDAVSEHSSDFMIISKKKIKGRLCTCSILKNIFRYIRYYGKRLEQELEFIINHFFINSEFKLYLIEIFCEMMNFMIFNYTDDSKVYRIFYQFNNTNCYEKFIELICKRKDLFEQYQQIQVNKEPDDFKRAQKKLLFFYFLFIFFSTNESNPIVFKDNFTCIIEIIKSICSSGKSKNYGKFQIKDYSLNLQFKHKCFISYFLQLLCSVFLEINGFSILIFFFKQTHNNIKNNLIKQINQINLLNIKLFFKNQIGAYFIMTRLIHDFLFFQIIQEIMKSLKEMPTDQIDQCYGLLIIEMLKLVEKAQEEDKIYSNLYQSYKQCIEIENEIFNLMEKHLNIINVKDFLQMQKSCLNGLDNIDLTQIIKYKISLEQIKAYLIREDEKLRQQKEEEIRLKNKQVYENQYELQYSDFNINSVNVQHLKYQYMMQNEQADNKIVSEEEEKQSNNHELNESNSNDYNKNYDFEQGVEFMKIENKFTKQKLVDEDNQIILIEIKEHKSGRSFTMSKLTSQIPSYEKNLCPLFNNKYRVIGSIIFQIYIQCESIEKAKQKIHSLVSTYGTPYYVQNFSNILLFIVTQLSLNLEYVRYHDENIMGINDYLAIQNHLPGHKADKVPIEKYYMDPENKLYDSDILTLQTILPLVESKKYFQSMLIGMNINLDNQFVQYNQADGPFNQNSLFPIFKDLKEKQIDNKEPIIVKRLKNFMKVVMMLGFDTICQLNCFNGFKDIFIKWMKPNLRDALNICFNFNKKMNINKLQQYLVNLNLSKDIPVKHTILTIAKINGDYFERLPNIPFKFEPFDFLRDKKLHNEYYQLLKEQSYQNQEIEYIIGNQFESLINENEFAKEIFNSMCSSDELFSIFYKILSSIEMIRYERMYQELIQYSLKYLYIYIYLNKSNTLPQIKEKLIHIVSDSLLIKNLQILKEEKELYKSIEKIEALLKDIRKQIQIERQESQLSNDDIEFSNSNTNNEEDEKSLFRKRAREAQQRQLEMMRQKSEKFKESNLNEPIHEIVSEQDKEIHVCLYCQDPLSKELQIIQAFIEKDNLDIFSNKRYKIPYNNKFKYIFQSCQHTYHYNCRDKAILNQKYKSTAFALDFNVGDNRRKIEGFCLQCRFLFNLGVPFVEQYLRKSLILHNMNEINNQVCSYQQEQIQNIEKCYQKVITIGDSIKEQRVNDITISINQMLQTLDLNFKEKEGFLKIKMIIECLVFSLSQIFDQGMYQFFKKSKLINSNFYLCARFILLNIIQPSELQACQSKLQNIIEFNWQVLTSLDKFTQQFFLATNYQQNDCFSDVQDMYIQTCICLAILTNNENEAAVKIISLSQIVFQNIVAVNSRILAIKSFSINDGTQTNQIGKNLNQQNHEEQDISNNSEINNENRVFIQNTYLENDEFMESLMGYIYPWCNLISSTLITIYSVNGENELEVYSLADKHQVDSDFQIYKLQQNMFQFMQIKVEMLALGIKEVDKNIDNIIKEQKNNLSPLDVLQNVQFHQSIKYQLAELGIDFKENHQIYFEKKCSLCKSYPHAAKSDLCICLICNEQMCSITCEKVNVFEELTFQQIEGNLNKHAKKAHEGKSIFLNLLENHLILIDAPMAIEYDNLFFDIIKQPMKIDINDFFTSQSWKENLLDKERQQIYINLLIKRQLPNKIRSIILSSSQNIVCKHTYI